MIYSHKPKHKVMKKSITNWMAVAMVCYACITQAQISCVNTLNVSLDANGVATISSDMLVEGTSIPNATVSLSSTGPFTPTLLLDCDDIGNNTIYVSNPADGSTCFSNVIVADLLGPTPYLLSGSSITLGPDCKKELRAIDFDLGSFDNCEIVSFAFGQNGYWTNPVTVNGDLIDMTVDHYFDENGNPVALASNVTQAQLDDYFDGNLSKWIAADKTVAIIFHRIAPAATALTISCRDAAGNVDYGNIGVGFPSCAPTCPTEPVNLGLLPFSASRTVPASYFFNYTTNWDSVEVSLNGGPYQSSVTFDCSSLISGTADIRYTYLGTTYDCSIPFSFNDIHPPVVAVNYELFVTLTDSSSTATITVDDIDEGSFDHCGIASRTLSQSTFTIDDLGPNTVTLTVEDVNGNWNQAWSTVYVHLEGACDTLSEANIQWPDNVVYVPDPTGNTAAWTPENLVNVYGFLPTQVRPTVNVLGCDIVGESKIDVTIELIQPGSNFYKVVRTWTLLSWETLNTYSFTHVLTNLPNADDYICDVLPRSAPLGDCASGHTDTDDVEWPNDIAIDDYRITPNELVDISNIDSLDAWPSLVNDATLYDLTYEDLLISLSAGELQIGRRWTATRPQLNLSWEYTQVITIDISGFGNLVGVSSPSGRAIPNVLINGSILTDAQGKAFAEEVSSIAKADQTTAGYTLKDLVLIYQHINSANGLSAEAALAGDIDNSGDLNLEDLEFLTDILFNKEISPDYRFEDYTKRLNTLNRPNYAFIGYKPGDVDFSVFSAEEILSSNVKYSIKDQLLNAGESYTVDVTVSDNVELHGLDLSWIIDNNQIEITGVYNKNNLVVYNLDDDNRLHILSPLTSKSMPAGESVIQISFLAKQNSLVSLSLIPSGTNNHFVGDDLKLYACDVEIVDKIPVSVLELKTKLDNINIYPNPASTYVNLNLSDITNDYTIDLISATGSTYITASNVSVIDVSNIPTGTYIAMIKSEGVTSAQKIHVIH